MVALRAAVFPLSAKNRRGGHFLPPPPSSARVKGLGMRGTRDVLAGRLEMGPRNIMPPSFSPFKQPLNPFGVPLP